MAGLEEILARLCSVLQPHAQEGVTVNANTGLADELGVDSAQLMEVLLEVEDEFDVSIPLNVLPNVVTVNDLATELESLLQTA